MKRKFFRNLVTFMICFIFALNISGFSISAKTTNNNAQLYSAKLQLGCCYVDGKYENAYYSTGNIYVKNLGTNKNVSVHYTYNGIDWFDQPATYYKTLSDGSEVWKFQTPYKSFLGARWAKCSCRFAIKYEVNGKTYWDNNNGNDYFLERGKNSSFISTVLSKSIVAFDGIWDGGANKHNVSIALQNLGVDKTVKVHYTKDNWKTSHQVDASYSNTTNNGLEFWGCTINEDSSSNFEFCISYTVNGITYWDNNFESNYRRYEL